MNSPLFGITLSLLIYVIMQKIQTKTKISILNPLLFSGIAIILILMTFKIPFEQFNEGGKHITALIGPATVSLAIPLYKNLDLLKKKIKTISIGILTSVGIHAITIVFLSILLSLNEQMAISLIPKSITTPFAKDLSETLGGIPAITISVVIVTGIFGAAISPFLNKTFNIKNTMAKGLALGSSAHAVGTSKAVENSEEEGAFSSIALILTGLLTVLSAPIIAYLIKFIIK